jgi:integrase
VYSICTTNALPENEALNVRTSLTQAIVRKYKSGDLWIYDTNVRGFVLRVRPSGVNSYLASLGRGKWYTIGRADVLKPEEARELARGVIGAVAKGKDPIAEKKKTRAASLADFLTAHYEPWVVANRKTGPDTMERIRGQFADTFGDTPLGAISPFAIERWRSARLKAGISALTANRDLAALKAALQKAVEWKLIDRHPLKDVKQARVDAVGRLRYLSTDEEQRLRAALDARDRAQQRARERANAWRRERGYRERPSLTVYGDHLTPLVLLALNTGLRFGELTALLWTDVDLVAALLTVRAEGAKSGKARHVPLNSEAVAVLRAWRLPDVDASAYVFPGTREGERLTTVKTAWMKLLKAATIQRFRFHDCRHTFASRLVQRGVDLNTVRELLGHADIKMTLRYAHLAPEHLSAAVAVLVQP